MFLKSVCFGVFGVPTDIMSGFVSGESEVPEVTLKWWWKVREPPQNAQNSFMCRASAQKICLHISSRDGTESVVVFWWFLNWNSSIPCFSFPNFATFLTHPVFWQPGAGRATVARWLLLDPWWESNYGISRFHFPFQVLGCPVGSDRING